MSCRKQRYTCPAGIWNYDNMVGARVAIRSTTIGNFNQFAVDGEYIIKDIYFRVSLDGKTITLIELEGLPDSYFTFKDVEILDTVNIPDKKSGELTVGDDITI